MTIYATRTAKLIVEPIEHKCPNCGTIHVMDMHVFQKYKAVLGLPVFPIDKTGVAFCTRCSQTLRRKEMPEAFLKTFNKIKNHTQIPVWTWAGTALIVAGIIAANLLMR
jgi:ribosomal protein S27AE